MNGSDNMLLEKINQEILIYNNNTIQESKAITNRGATTRNVGTIGIFLPMTLRLDEKSCASTSRVNDDTKSEILLDYELVTIKFVDVLGDHKKTKFKPSSITMQPILGFDENNNYTLKFKGFTFSFFVYEGAKMKPKTMQLGEFYEKYQNNSEKSVVIEEMFQEIDDHIKFLNNTFKEQLQKIIKIAELD